MHTSTITVAVLAEPKEHEVRVDPRDVEEETMRGTGTGGQHKNVTDSCVRLTHRPTGIVVRCESERSQHANKATAWAVLRARIAEQRRAVATGERADDRRRQVGSGMRGDKRRTIRTQDGVVNDRVTSKQWRFRDYERGNW